MQVFVVLFESLVHNHHNPPMGPTELWQMFGKKTCLGESIEPWAMWHCAKQRLRDGG